MERKNRIKRKTKTEEEWHQRQGHQSEEKKICPKERKRNQIKGKDAILNQDGKTKGINFLFFQLGDMRKKMTNSRPKKKERTFLLFPAEMIHFKKGNKTKRN